MSTKKTLHMFDAIAQISQMTNSPHWVGITCDHNDDSEKERWVGAVLTHPDNIDAPSYFMHSFGKHHPDGVKVFGINTGLNDLPDKAGPLKIRKADNTDIQLMCGTCQYTPDINVDDLVDVAALWVKSVFGPTIDLDELPHLAARWGEGEPA